MPVLELRPTLTEEERLDKRKLIINDVVALSSLLAITSALAVLTYVLFSSYTQHRQTLGQRWLARGDAALAAGRPAQAVEALRAALDFIPDRQTEIKLATALADSGRSAEAIAYFNSLLEAEPGNGLIHLQLARLAAKQNHEQLAIDHYREALDGVWNGDGYQRRLSVRLELSQYLMSHGDPASARSQLLIAEGNAADDPGIKLRIASMMEAAQDPASAYHVYHQLAQQKPARVEALEGAGRTAFALGRYAAARTYLDRAIAQPEFAGQSEDEREAYRAMFTNAQRLLALYPAPELRAMERARRVVNAVGLARARLQGCSENAAQAPANLADLNNRWQQVPAKLTASELARDQDQEQSLMQLVYDTEVQTANICGAPTGDDALLLKLAQSQAEGEQQ
ncbi:tetratricopeptide repeat protein [Silvibacterium acidisoli]|uniref:tetratricopeptide repeat protein n=1 Tax=Acidobacteriaceae bacterium ZG23-2 TaxID=2883246 RepID=UPI00406C88E3